MTTEEIVKSGVGSLQGLGKSKKYGLTVAFATTCLGLLATVQTEILQVACIAAATATVVGYLFSQSKVEAAAAEKDNEEAFKDKDK